MYNYLVNLLLLGKHHYWPQQSCGQGYVFTHVRDSVHKGGSPGRENPLGPDPPGPHTHPLAGRTPRAGEPPRADPPRADPPQARRTPQDQTLPGQGEPPLPPPQSRHPHRTRPPPPPSPLPGKQTPAYGLRVAGTHPTGMHSCFI